MAARRIRRLPVVAAAPAGARLIGAVTATDPLHAFPADVDPFAIEAPVAGTGSVRVGELVQREVMAVRPDEPIEGAALMCERKVGGRPVVRDGRRVGLVTESDAFRAFVSLFAAPQRGLPVTRDAPNGLNPFAVVTGLAVGRPLEV